VADGSNAFNNQDNDYDRKVNLILTGHNDGSVLVFSQQKYQGRLCKYNCEIEAMSLCFLGLAVGLKIGQIRIWSHLLDQELRLINLEDMPFKCLSRNITSVDFSQKNLLVLTKGGDAIEIKLSKSQKQKY